MKSIGTGIAILGVWAGAAGMVYAAAGPGPEVVMAIMFASVCAVVATGIIAGSLAG